MDEIYVQCILMILRSDERTPPSYREMAKKLGLQYAGIRKRLMKLTDMGLLCHHLRSEIALTEQGLGVAREMQRQFSYIYFFFHHMLELAHPEAERYTYFFLGNLSEQTRQKLVDHVSAAFTGMKSDSVNLPKFMAAYIRHVSLSYNHGAPRPDIVDSLPTSDTV